MPSTAAAAMEGSHARQLPLPRRCAARGVVACSVEGKLVVDLVVTRDRLRRRFSDGHERRGTHDGPRVRRVWSTRAVAGRAHVASRPLGAEYARSSFFRVNGAPEVCDGRRPRECAWQRRAAANATGLRSSSTESRSSPAANVRRSDPSSVWSSPTKWLTPRRESHTPRTASWAANCG